MVLKKIYVMLFLLFLVYKFFFYFIEIMFLIGSKSVVEKLKLISLASVMPAVNKVGQVHSWKWEKIYQ